MKNELIRIAKFGSVGLCGTCTHALVFFIIFTVFTIGSVIANFIAFCIALCVSYVGHTNFTFKDKVKDAKLGWDVRWRFFQTTFLGFILNMAWAYLFLEKWQWDISTFIIALFTLTPALAYLLNRFWVFNNLQKQSAQ